MMGDVTPTLQTAGAVWAGNFNGVANEGGALPYAH